MARVKKEPEQELPLIRSVALHKIEGLWVVLTIYTQGEKVITVEHTTPTAYNIALSQAKVEFIKTTQHNFGVNT